MRNSNSYWVIEILARSSCRSNFENFWQLSLSPHPLARHHSATLSGCCLLYLTFIAYLPFRSLFLSLVCGCCIFTGNKAFCHTNTIPIDWGDAIGRVFLTVTLFDTSQQIHSLIAMIPAAAGGRLRRRSWSRSVVYGSAVGDSMAAEL